MRSSERPSAPSDCTRAEVLAAPVCGPKLLPAGAMHGETDLGEGGAPGASARGRSGEVVLLTGQCPVVELPAHDQKAAAQQKAIGALDAGKRKALGPMLTAERVRCKRPKLSKADIEAALWLRGVQPARKSGGSGVANAPVLELQLLGLFGEDAGEPGNDGAAAVPLVAAVAACLSVADMGRCVRSSLLDPDADKAALAYKLPQSADALRKILKCLDALAEYESVGGEFPKLHAAVSQVHTVSDAGRRSALLNALRVEVTDAIQRSGSKGAAEKEKQTRDKAAQNDSERQRAHPVLSRMGNKGQLRLLWEYYKVYASKRPALDAPAIFPCGPANAYMHI